MRIFLARRLVTSTTVAVMAVVAVLATAVPGAAAQPPPERADEPVSALAVGSTTARRIIHTAEYGVDHPVGLAIDPTTNIRYLVADGGQTLVGIGENEDPAGSRDGSGITDPLSVVIGSRLDETLTVSGDSLVTLDLIGASPTTSVSGLGVAAAAGVAHDAQRGVTYVLDSAGPSLVDIGRSGRPGTLALDALAGRDVRGIAHNPSDGLLYIGSSDASMLWALDTRGSLQAVYDLSGSELIDPGAMVFGLTSDGTDDPGALSLFVADRGGVDRSTAGGGVVLGRLVEVSLLDPAVGAQQADFAARAFAALGGMVVLENTVALSALSPPSPDSAGITYIPMRDRLLVSDSEVNEMPIFASTQTNLFELTRSGSLTDTGNSTGWSDEPTGVSYNPGTGHLFVSDDTGTRSVYQITPGPDGRFGTADDNDAPGAPWQLATSAFGSTDPEGVAFDTSTGDIFILDGVNKEVYHVTSADGQFDGVGESVSQFDVLGFGAEDPEGIAYNQFSDTLLVLDEKSKAVYELTKAGSLIRVIDISITGGKNEAGIVLAPASDGSPGWNMFIVDRGTDNDSDPNENDGVMFELSLDFGPMGSPPVAVDDPTGTAEDVAVVVDVLANDSDPDLDLDPSSVTVLAPGPTNGSAVVTGSPPGAITYTPDPDFNGSDQFDYQVCDLAGSCDTATVTVSVTPVPDAPVAVDDVAATPSSVAVVVDVLDNDSDPDLDLDPSSVTVLASGPANGSAVVTGTPPGAITYTPDPGFVGTDAFDYQVCDLGGLCDTATVTVSVTGSPPVAVDDPTGTAEDVAVVVDVLANDSDPDFDLDPSSVTVLAPGPTNGSAVVTGTPPGAITYTPDPDFNGSDQFDYQVCDVTGLCDTATVTVSVTAVPDAPDAVDDAAATPFGVAVLVDVLANDSDPESNLDPSSVTVITPGPPNGSAVVTGSPPGAIAYTPDPGFAGTDAFDYQVCDLGGLCDTATVTVTVDPVVTDPTYYLSFSGSTSVPGVGTARDEDIVIYDSATGTWAMHLDGSDVGIGGEDVAAFHVRSNGSLLISLSSSGIIPGLTGGPDGLNVDDSDILLFTPTSTGQVTTGTFSFLFDGSDVGLVSSGEDIDGLYEFADGSLGISTTGSFSVAGLASGTDADVHRFTPTLLGATTTGTWTLHFDGTDVGLSDINADVDALWFDESNDMLFSTVGTYSAAGGSGDDEDVSTFTGTYGATTTGTATLTLDLSALGINISEDLDGIHRLGLAGPAAPLAVNDVAATPSGLAVVVDVLDNDSDPDFDLDPSSVTVLASGPANGSAVVTGTPPGAITYTPDPGFVGTDAFDYQVCDLGGLCDTATVSVSVTGSPPVAVDDPTGTAEDVAVVVDVLANDSDPDFDLDPSSVTVLAPGPTNGSAVVTGTPPGAITYTPDPDFNGSDQFDYQVCDVTGLCDTATVTVSVTAVPDAPDAVDDLALTDEGVAVLVDVLANDSDPESNLDPSSVTVVAPGAPNGSAVVTGTPPGAIAYTPDPGFEGTDAFDYQVCDLGGLCDTATVTVTVGSAGTDATYYLSFGGSTTVPGVGTVRDEDIVIYDSATDTWALHFDGSDVGIGGEDVAAFHVRSNGSLLISLSSSGIIPGLTGGPDGLNVDDSDILLFTPTSTGPVTAGTFSFLFDGSDVGLVSGSEDIDGLHEFADGSLGVSTKGSFSVAGLASGTDADVHRFTPTLLGATTTGTWSLYFDGTDVGFSTAADDLSAVSFNTDGDMLFSTVGTYSAAGGSGDDEDVSTFTGTYGATTTGTATLTLDLSALGINIGEKVDGIHSG